MIVFRAARDINWDDVRVIAATLKLDGRIYAVAKPVEFDLKPYDYRTLTDPTFRFTNDEAQNLMSALWEAGIRPAGVSSPSSEIKRMEAHLEDMRKLVFKNAS